MFKWIKYLKELVRDIKQFLEIRKEQKRLYGPIIEDLETINALSNALNEQIKKFAQRWNLFPEVKDLIAVYRKYVDESQDIYKKTRKSVLNELFAERNKRLMGDDADSLQVSRRDITIDPNDLKWKLVIKNISLRNMALGVALDLCSVEIIKDTIKVIIKQGEGVDLIIENHQMIVFVCKQIFGEDMMVEFVEAGGE